MSFFFTNTAYAESLDTFLGHVGKYIVNPLIIMLFALAIMYFLWGIFEFIQNADNEEKRSAGKQHMIYGVIGIVIMMGVFAILNIIMATFGIQGITPESGQVTLPPYNPSASGNLP